MKGLTILLQNKLVLFSGCLEGNLLFNFKLAGNKKIYCEKETLVCLWQNEVAQMLASLLGFFQCNTFSYSQKVFLNSSGLISGPRITL